jgi:hypothetical protein
MYPSACGRTSNNSITLQIVGVSYWPNFLSVDAFTAGSVTEKPSQPENILAATLRRRRPYESRAESLT